MNRRFALCSMTTRRRPKRYSQLPSRQVTVALQAVELPRRAHQSHVPTERLPRPETGPVSLRVASRQPPLATSGGQVPSAFDSSSVGTSCPTSRPPRRWSTDPRNANLLEGHARRATDDAVDEVRGFVARQAAPHSALQPSFPFLDLTVVGGRDLLQSLSDLCLICFSRRLVLGPIGGRLPPGCCSFFRAAPDFFWDFRVMASSLSPWTRDGRRGQA